MDEEVSDAGKIKAFSKLFVIEGRQIFDFIKSTILKQIQPICQINAHNTSVFQLPDTGDYLCVIDDSVMDQAAQITNLLAPWMEKAQHIYSFKFQPAYTYNTDGQFDKECFIRTIPSTTDTFGLNFIAPMEDCNIVHGVSAGGLFALESTIRISLAFQNEIYNVFFFENLQCPHGATFTNDHSHVMAST